MAADEFALRVEVVYALPERQVVLEIEVTPGTTVDQAIAQSGIASRFPEVDLAKAPVGVFGRRVAHDAPVHEGDRIEIYRPLTADPKTLRRQRSARKR
jgi:putative ubiquitin-RnfH superfamily antitoxin RatB of RatAB toxin-antitoxin module